MTNSKQTSATTPHSFGFEAQMREADWSRFSAWYVSRCLLAGAARARAKQSQLPQ